MGFALLNAMYVSFTRDPEIHFLSTYAPSCRQLITVAATTKCMIIGNVVSWRTADCAYTPVSGNPCDLPAESIQVIL